MPLPYFPSSLRIQRKKLSLLGAQAQTVQTPAGPNVFWFFFSKKNFFFPISLYSFALALH
jgi:hypothetical protein